MGDTAVGLHHIQCTVYDRYLHRRHDPGTDHREASSAEPAVMKRIRGSSSDDPFCFIMKEDVYKRQDIESMVYAAKLLDQQTGCDIIDINMGCPVNKVIKAHAGSALMKEPEHAQKLVELSLIHILTSSVPSFPTAMPTASFPVSLY